MSSIRTNYLLNLINIISGLLFPLISFPYASRIMQADGIGQVNFFSSIISYISLFTCLGIPMYAIRETARVRDDKIELSKISIEILLIHTGLTLLGYMIVGILCFTVAKMKADIPLFLLLSTNILFVAVGCDWFYQGIEDFKYITIRGLVVKILSLVLLFVFVRTKNDLMYYAAYSVIGSVGGNIFNFIRLRKYIKVRFCQFKELHPLRHLRPALRIFVLNLIISLYANLDTIMLGFFKDTTVVGYYTGATKLTKMLMGLVSSLGTVMLPRLSNILRCGQQEEFNRLSQKAIDFTLAFSFPLFLGLLALAPTLIHLFCGSSYEPAILTLQIISPILLIIALSNVMGIQILYPQGKENLVIYSTVVGALLNIILNLILIPFYAQNGAAVATVIAEVGVTVSMMFIGRLYLPVKLFTRHYANCIIASIVMFIVCLLAQVGIDSDVIRIFAIPILGVIVYIVFLYIQKDSILVEFIPLIKRYMIKRNDYN